MKKILSLLICVAVSLGSCAFAMPVSAAGPTLKVTASSATVKPGDTVKVTLQYTADKGIGAIQATLKYNAEIMDFVSVDGWDSGYGNAGVTTLLFLNKVSTPAKSFKGTVTFKAKAVGNCVFSATTVELLDWVTEESLGTPSGKATVNVINPVKSSNANLSALYISSGSLSPKFSPTVTSYQITLPYTVTVLTVSAETADKNATVTVEGSKEMKVEKNTRVVKVTAPNGTVKSYTLNITRQENTGAPTTAPHTTPTTGLAGTAAQVTVGEEIKYIARDLTGVTPPLGYEKTTVTINDTAFPAMQNTTRTVTLLYLTDDKGGNGALHLYDTTDMTFSAFHFAEVKAGVFTFLTPDGADLPVGFNQTFLNLGNNTVSALQFSDPAMVGYYLVYGASPAGSVGWYQYDSVENTFQRYTAPTSASPETNGPDSLEQPKPAQGVFAKIRTFFVNLWTEWGAVRFSVVFGGGTLLLIAVIVLIVLLAKRPRHYRH